MAPATQGEFRCRNCDSSQALPAFRQLPDRLSLLPGRFDYARCAHCGLLQLENAPDRLADYYTGYGVHAEDSPVYGAFRQLLIGHSYPLADGRDGTCLDVGCGNGWYLKALTRRGWRPVGYEPDAAFAAALSQRLGIPVLCRQEELAAYAGSCALVTFNFSFEHLEDPKRLLMAALQCVAPGGRVVIAVPNIEGREARLFDRWWFHLDPPRHVTFFTKAALTALLVGQGFTRVRVRNLAVPTGFAGSLSYWLSGRFTPWLWYAGMLPGLVFCQVVRDGNFQIWAERP